MNHKLHVELEDLGCVYCLERSNRKIAKAEQEAKAKEFLGKE